MTIPANFTTALATRSVSTAWWVEIEGVPWAFGTFTDSGTWFSARDQDQRFASIEATLMDVPHGADPTVDLLDGTFTSGRWELKLADRYGTLATVLAARRTDKRLYVSTTWAKAPAYPATLAYADPEGVDTQWDASGYLWVDRECLAYSAIDTGANTLTVTAATDRRQYRTRAESHNGPVATEPGQALGRPITPYMPFLATRQAWVYLALNGGADADKVARFTGTITGARLADDGHSVVLSLTSVDKRIGGWMPGGRARKKVFESQGRGQLDFGLPGRAGEYDAAKIAEYGRGHSFAPLSTGVAYDAGLAWDSVGANVSWLSLRDEPHSRLPTTGTSVLKIDDEYVAATMSGSRVLSARGLFGSEIEPHYPTAPVKEIFVIAKYDAGHPVLAASKFTGSYGSNPVDVILALLLSTGRGDNNATYDLLPAGWGAGIEAARVDVAGLEALRAQHLDGVQLWGLIEDPFDLRELLAKELLQPFGLYLVPQLNDVLSVRRLGMPMPSASMTTIDTGNRLDRSGWDAGISEVVGAVVYKTDWDEVRGRFAHVAPQEFVDAVEQYDGLYRTITLESRFLRYGWPSNGWDDIPGVGASGHADILSERAQFWQRFSAATPTIVVPCDYGALSVNVGDFVAFTDSQIPTTTAATRGVTARTLLVTGKEVRDTDRHPVRLTLLDYTLSGDNFRRISPCAEVASIDALVVTVEVNIFSTTADGTDTTAFTAGAAGTGDIVRVFNTTLATDRGSARVTAKSATSLTLDAVPAGTTAGDIILFDSYDSQTTAQRATYASLADTSDLLGSGNAAAHTWV